MRRTFAICGRRLCLRHRRRDLRTEAFDGRIVLFGDEPDHDARGPVFGATT